ncbi:MAG: agmatinase [Planctomycetes bacterium]|nr:agmatinase [Planctomycetota bacterium]
MAKSLPNTVPDNFLGLPAAQATYDDARFVVVPIPYDATASFGVGARAGPRAIITASQHVECYDTDLGREPRLGVATLPSLEPDTRGPQAMLERVYQVTRRVLGDGKFPVTLGGEHSLTSALVRAVRKSCKDVCVLQIDAHADLRDTYQGSPFSHACVMRRIHEMGVHFVGVGVRSYSAAEARFMRSNGLRIVTARTCREERDWITGVLAGLGPRVYVTVDIDGFDPAAAPGTGAPEPGGLNWFQVTDLLRAVAARHEIVGADVMEVCPQPPSTVTEFLAARLMHHLMGLVVAR